MKLKVALLLADCPAYAIAQAAGLSETRLSRIVTGRIDPTREERAKIADALGIRTSEIFQDTETVGREVTATSNDTDGCGGTCDAT